jgi:hypothetical protein
MGEKRKKVLCFDFDGVIATYDGWKGFDVLGEPNFSVIEAMNRLYTEGYFITIFTTRPFTQKMTDWLIANGVLYHSVNSNAHNPPMTSQKPIYHVIIDDRALRYEKQKANELIAQIKSVVDVKE